MEQAIDFDFFNPALYQTQLNINQPAQPTAKRKNKPEFQLAPFDKIMAGEFVQTIIFSITESVSYLKSVYPHAVPLFDLNFICNTILYDNSENTLSETLGMFYEDFENGMIYDNVPNLNPHYVRNLYYEWAQYTSDVYNATLDDFIHEVVPGGKELIQNLYANVPPTHDQKLHDKFMFGKYLMNAYESFVVNLFSQMENYVVTNTADFMNKHHLSLLGEYNEYMRRGYPARRDEPYLITSFSYRGLKGTPNDTLVVCDLSFKLLR